MKFRPCRDTFFNIYFRCPITRAISSITAGFHRIPPGKIPPTYICTLFPLAGTCFWIFIFVREPACRGSPYSMLEAGSCHAFTNQLFPNLQSSAATRVPVVNEEIMGFQSRPQPALHHLLPTRHPQIQTLPAVCPGTSKPARMTADVMAWGQVR
jgi:hypothetical protein